MANRKNKHLTVRKAGQRGLSLYVPTWIAKKFRLREGDEFTVAGDEQQITLKRSEGGNNE